MMKQRLLSLSIAFAFLFSSVFAAGEVFAVDDPVDEQPVVTEEVVEPVDETDGRATLAEDPAQSEQGEEPVVTDEPVVSDEPEEPAEPIDKPTISEDALAKAPTILSYEQDEEGNYILTFSADLRVSGLEVQYGTSKVFLGGSTKSVEIPAVPGIYEVNDSESVEIPEEPGADLADEIDETNEPAVADPAEPQEITVVLKGLKAGKIYYARVRSYIDEEDGTRSYSPWAVTSNIKDTSTASISRLKYGSKVFDLYPLAGQKLGGYDTMQGGCNDGTYFYYVLYDRNKENCKVVKVRISDRKVMKVSAVTGAAHGNGITYNRDTNELILTYTMGKPNKLVVLDAKTLKVKKRVTVTIPKTLEGNKGKRLSKITGFIDIVYMSEKQQYAALTKGSTEVMILNSKFKPVRMICLSKKKAAGYSYQGLDVTEDYILVAESGYPNVVVVYDWNGKYQSKIDVLKGWEIENISHVDDAFYVGVYANNTYTAIEKYKKFKHKTKTKKVWKKKRVYNKRTKRYYTKWYRAKVKKRVKTKKYTWATRKVTHVVRNNYIYQIKM